MCDADVGNVHNEGLKLAPSFHDACLQLCQFLRPAYAQDLPAQLTKHFGHTWASRCHHSLLDEKDRFWICNNVKDK